jgi:hypothetical protein
MPDNLTAADLVYRDSVSAATTGGAAGANKLWLPLWSGEVINAYDHYNVFENLITAKSLSGGFSWEFPVTGTVALKAAWNAGEELVGGDSASTTFKVNLDPRPMAAHFETDNVDLLITQWDYRSELARQAGMTLANTRDTQVAAAVVAACAVDALASDPRGLTNANFPQPVEVSTGAPSAANDSVGLKILKAIEDYFVFMQENNYPVDNVYCVVTPKVFQVIRALGITRAGDTNAFEKVPLFGTGQEYGGIGMPLSSGMNSLTDMLTYMGCKILKSNHLPKSQLAIGATKYNLNCSAINLHGFIFQPEAVAGLSLMGMKVDTVQDVRRNTQFTVASMQKGTGVLRPELCQALVGAAAGALDTRAELRTALGANLTSGFAAEYAVTA